MARSTEPGTKGIALTFVENGRRVQETYRFDPSTWFLTSSTVLEDGNVIEKNLRRNRLTSEEIAAEARNQQIDSFDGIRWAVLETSGKISFIEKGSS